MVLDECETSSRARAKSQVVGGMLSSDSMILEAQSDMVLDEYEAPSRAEAESRDVEGVLSFDPDVEGMSGSNPMILEAQKDEEESEDEDEDEDEKDLFLEALLRPNEHAHRLLNTRTRVAELCRVSDVLRGYISVENILRSMVASFSLLRGAGLMQDSLILLTDDPGRPGVVQTVEFDVREIEDLAFRGTTGAISQGIIHKLLGMLGLADQKVGSLRDEQIMTFGALLALATASYAGSHCQSFGERMPEPKAVSEITYLCPGFSLRSCRFACLDRYIGGPVWVFGKGDLQEDMLLSITAKHFDDLWGPVTELAESQFHDTRTIALQTEGGFLTKMEPSSASLLSFPMCGNEIPMHWTPAQPGCRSLPGTRIHSSFDLNATMLIGFDGQKEDSACHKKPANASKCFDTNRNCKLDAKSYEISLKARSFEYIGTATRQWVIDTKAVNIAAGWSGPSIGTTRTWKLRPATSWKAAMLLYCNQPGRDIQRLMDLRVGLARSICTGNARRVTLFEALRLAFPEEQETMEDLVRSAKTDENSR
jgi:hypothetical protein